MQKSVYFLVLSTLLSLFIVTATFAETGSSPTISGELSNTAGRLKSESIDFVTTPFQIENGNIFITAAVVGGVAALYSADTNIRDKVAESSSKSLDKAAKIGSLAGDPFIHIGLSAIVYAGGIAADSMKYKEIGEMMGEAAIIADASTFIIKEAAGRGRPLATDSKGDFKPFGFKNDYDSFPSMHTASSFALASVLAGTSESMIAKISYYSAASFVAFSRVYQNKHWASDVAFGAVIGELAGRVAMNCHVKKKKISLVPTALENGAGLAMVGRW